MDVSELRAVLERLESLYAAAGSSTAAKDLKRVSRLLEGYDGMSVEAFLAETRKLLDRPANALSAAVDVDCVGRHADKLLAAGMDQSAFESALCALDDDTQVGKAEWAAIANRYRNAPTQGTHVYKFKSNKEARAAIRDAFIERHEAASKRGIIARITKWAS